MSEGLESLFERAMPDITVRVWRHGTTGRPYIRLLQQNDGDVGSVIDLDPEQAPAVARWLAEAKAECDRAGARDV